MVAEVQYDTLQLACCHVNTSVAAINASLAHTANQQLLTTDEARSQNPFDNAAQPLQQQATSRHLWRSLKIEERRAKIYAWGVVKGPTARMTLLSGGHSAIVTDCTKARDAIRYGSAMTQASC